MDAEEVPFSFPISKIVIGNWIRSQISPDDLLIKLYIQSKKLTWEMVGVNAEAGGGLKRKMEVNWDDVLSCRMIHNSDGTGFLDVEMRKRPTFLMETHPSPSSTQWEKIDEDFTWNQAASTFRTHTLHFPSRVLQEMMSKLVSGDNFWKELLKVGFPTLPESLVFEQDLNTENDGQIRRHFWHDDGTHMTSIAEDNDGNSM